MLCSEVIDKLSRLLKDHGDYEVWTGSELDYHLIEDVGVVRKNRRGHFTDNKKCSVDHFWID